MTEIGIRLQLFGSLFTHESRSRPKREREGKNTIPLFIDFFLGGGGGGQLSRRGKLYKTNNARLLVHLWAEIMHSVLDSPPGYTALGPADLGAVYPGALLAHRALFGPKCTRTRALSV